jgi:hypothetical protein
MNNNNKNNNTKLIRQHNNLKKTVNNLKKYQSDVISNMMINKNKTCGQLERNEYKITEKYEKAMEDLKVKLNVFLQQFEELYKETVNNFSNSNKKTKLSNIVEIVQKLINRYNNIRRIYAEYYTSSIEYGKVKMGIRTNEQRIYLSINNASKIILLKAIKKYIYESHPGKMTIIENLQTAKIPHEDIKSIYPNTEIPTWRTRGINAWGFVRNGITEGLKPTTEQNLYGRVQQPQQPQPQQPQPQQRPQRPQQPQPQQRPQPQPQQRPQPQPQPQQITDEEIQDLTNKITVDNYRKALRFLNITNTKNIKKQLNMIQLQTHNDKNRNSPHDTNRQNRYRVATSLKKYVDNSI